MSTILLALALALAAQQPTAPSNPPLRSDFPPPPAMLTPAHDLYFREFERLAPVARTTVHQFGACVAERSRQLAADILNRDFTTRSYDRGLHRLAATNHDCLRGRGTMRSADLLFAGAIAERLIAEAPEPLNVRLARAASRPAPPTYSQGDRIAVCVVRSVPDDTARLFAAEVASDAEFNAVRALELPIRACSAGGPRVEATAAGLRAILATAAFRTLASVGNEEGSN